MSVTGSCHIAQVREGEIRKRQPKKLLKIKKGFDFAKQKVIADII